MTDRRFRAVAGALVLLCLFACGGKKDLLGPPTDEPMPDFALTDVNPASTSAGVKVSPRQSLNQVSAWYFAFAT